MRTPLSCLCHFGSAFVPSDLVGVFTFGGLGHVDTSVRHHDRASDAALDSSYRRRAGMTSAELRWL